VELRPPPIRREVWRPHTQWTRTGACFLAHAQLAPLQLPEQGKRSDGGRESDTLSNQFLEAQSWGSDLVSPPGKEASRNGRRLCRSDLMHSERAAAAVIAAESPGRGLCCTLNAKSDVISSSCMIAGLVIPRTRRASSATLVSPAGTHCCRHTRVRVQQDCCSLQLPRAILLLLADPMCCSDDESGVSFSNH